jgi:TRAP-type C4-dicarboxylate transport system permease small subunit
LKKISDLLGKGIYICLSITSAGLLAIILWQIFCRFILQISAYWVEEIIRLSFVWMIFLGATIACKNGTHLALDMLTSILTIRIRFILQIFVLLFMLATEAFILWGSIWYFIRCIGKVAITLPIPANCVYISGPISAVLMIFFTFEVLYRKLTGKEALK